LQLNAILNSNLNANLLQTYYYSLNANLLLQGYIRISQYRNFINYLHFIQITLVDGLVLPST